MDLCKETICDTSNDDIQYARHEEANRIYDFLVGLNPKFDIVCGRILGQRPIFFAIEACYEGLNPNFNAYRNVYFNVFLSFPHFINKISLKRKRRLRHTSTLPTTLGY